MDVLVLPLRGVVGGVPWSISSQSQVVDISDFNNTSPFLKSVLIADNLSFRLEGKMAEKLTVAVS